MRLTYREPRHGPGKTSDDSDQAEVRLTRVAAGERIERQVSSVSDDPAFSGTMRMTRTFPPAGAWSLVTVRAEDVPEGIRPEDHQLGLRSSLEKLARFTGAGAG